MRKVMTVAELEAIPVESTIRITAVNSDEETIWYIFAEGKCVLVAEDFQETEDLEWFASDSPSWSRGEGRDGWPWEVEVIERKTV